uniref:Uncharacterized protein n=1 Tax=Oryza nivara TaxID=4536 RepID=A0A0E0J7V0_ORYNI
MKLLTGTIVSQQTFKRQMIRIILSWNSIGAMGFNAVDVLFRIFLEQTSDPTIKF